MASQTRIEKDSMGEMTVPAHVLYGASTQRAVLNFPVSGRTVGPLVIHAFALLKKACAEANMELKKSRRLDMTGHPVGVGARVGVGRWVVKPA